MSDLQKNKFQYVSAPRSQGELVQNPSPGVTTFGTGQGLVAVLPGSASPQVLSLVTLFSAPMSATNAWAQGQLPTGEPLGLNDAYVTFYADGVDFGMITGETFAIVSGSNAPSLAASGTLDGFGNYTAAGNECWRLPAGQMLRILLAPGIDKYLGFVAASATGFLRIYQSSPQMC